MGSHKIGVFFYSPQCLFLTPPFQSYVYSDRHSTKTFCTFILHYFHTNLLWFIMKPVMVSEFLEDVFAGLHIPWLWDGEFGEWPDCLKNWVKMYKPKDQFLLGMHRIHGGHLGYGFLNELKCHPITSVLASTQCSMCLCLCDRVLWNRAYLWTGTALAFLWSIQQADQKSRRTVLCFWLGEETRVPYFYAGVLATLKRDYQCSPRQMLLETQADAQCRGLLQFKECVLCLRGD